MERRVLACMGLVGLLSCFSGAASAGESLGLRLTNPDLTGPPGSVLVLDGILHNFTDQVLHINGLSSTLGVDYGAADQFEYFLRVMPKSLVPGEVWEGPLLKITISPEAPIATRSFAITIVGGEHRLAHDLLETGYFGVDDSTAVVTVPDVVAPAHATVHASPNPFDSRMELSISLPTRQDIDVAVYDAAGHRVRHLYDGAAETGLQRYLWDGANDQGRKMSSGIYYVRVRSEERVLKTKVVLCR